MLKNSLNEEYTHKIIRFLNTIGIDVELRQLKNDTFLPGVSIVAGSLIVDLEKLAYPGDLLHEAGHIAIQPEETRHLLNENVNEAGQGDGEEIAAIAWSWAALTELGLPPEVVFHEAGYRGSSQSLIECFQSGGYYGQPLLSFYQMCSPLDEMDSFPMMKHWLRPPQSCKENL